MRGFLAVAMLLMFLACVSGAQQPPPDDPVRLLRDDGQRRAQWANEWLRSGDPRQVAWGAWLARQDRRTELIPLLLQQVREYQPTQLPPPAALDHHDALLVVLDALIELNATVPVEDARKLYSQFPAQSLILLVRSREDNQSALLEILQNAKANWNWLAAGNVLAQKRTPGFAALLLSRFTQHITVTVIDERLGGLLGGLISECAPLHRAPKQGWPPVGLYELTQIPERIRGSRRLSWPEAKPASTTCAQS
ncbi:MAG TPA: hypothetical protein VD837_04295 [Terriglobales bacterium]|nr:hypothetical protein [Terriglobales bacterium]